MSVLRFKQDLALIILSGIIGYFGLSGTPRLATLILAVPIFRGMANTRMGAFAVMLLYFLTVSRGLLPGAAVFLSKNHTFFQAAAVYFIMPLGVSLPFFVFWSRERKKKALCLILAFATAFVLPPISLIGIVNPLMAAGTVFRGSDTSGWELPSSCSFYASFPSESPVSFSVS